MEKWKRIALFAHAKIGRLCLMSDKLSGLITLGMMIIICVDTIGRYAFNSPLIWGYEVSEMLLALIIYLSIAYTDFEDSHISVSLLVVRLAPRMKELVFITTRFVALIFCTFLTYGTGKIAILSLIAWEVTPNSGIPMAPVKAVVALGLFMFSLELLTKILSLSLKRWDKHRAA